MRVGLGLSEQQRCAPLVLALLAMVTMQLFRADQQWHSAFVWVDSSVAVTLALVIAAWMARRRQPTGEMRGAARSRAERTVASQVVALVSFSLLPIVTQGVSRCFGLGDPNETVALLCLQNAGLASSLSPQVSHRRATCLLNSFLVLFVLFATVDVAVYVAAGVFGFVGAWTLMGNYWERLSVRLAVRSRAQVPLRGSLMLVSLLVLLSVLALGAFWGRRGREHILTGFMPTSGGDRRGGEYGRSGVGDGDQLIAAMDTASTFGAVESDLFLTSQQPSLYDTFNDMYGEPVRQQEQTRAVALESRQGRESEERIAETQQAGREFAAVRRRRNAEERAAHDRLSPALLLVQGDVPVHLRLQTYNRFDGRNWSHAETEHQPPRFFLRSVEGRPWMRTDMFDPCSMLGGQRAHVVKVLNLRSPRIAAPANLAAWSIDRIDRENFFRWTGDDVLEMPDRPAVPALTVVHLISLVAERDKLVTYGSVSARSERLPGSDALDVAHRATAQSWVAGLPRGWPQVEAVVRTLRTQFAHDRAAVAPEDSPDVVAHFLAARRGPDYLFASTAAVLLRSLDYRTRLVSGFYAHAGHYDAQTGHTRVDQEDVHVWLEVCLDRHNWLPLEPTPGYDEPPLHLNWRESIVRAYQIVWFWCVAHRAALGLALVLLAASVRWRRELFDVIAWVAWWLCAGRGAAPQRVRRTLLLLEWRAWMAGQPRPPHCTLSAWHRRFLGGLPAAAATALAEALRLGDWSLYGAPESPLACEPDTLQRICDRCARQCTARRLYGCRPPRRRWLPFAARLHRWWQYARHGKLYVRLSPHHS